MATSKKSVTAPAVEEVKAAVPTPVAKPKAASKTVAKPVAKKATKAAEAPVAAAVEKAPAKAVAKKAAVKAPAKTATKPAVKAAAPKKAKPVTLKSADIDPGQRAHYIEVAAYYIAERRGFTPGDPGQDYLDAAAEVDRLIESGHFGK